MVCQKYARMFRESVILMVALATIGMVLTGGLFAAPVAANHANEVGASGSCGAIDGGGNSSTSVGDNGVDEPEPQETADAVVYLLENGGECHEEDNHDGYIEAHVSGEGQGHVQVCIDESDQSAEGVSAGPGEEPCSTDG